MFLFGKRHNQTAWWRHGITKAWPSAIAPCEQKEVRGQKPNLPARLEVKLSLR